MSKKNFITVLISSFLSILLCYFLFFLKIHFEHLHKHPFRFKSIDTLKFNKNYYNKLHHLRDVDGRWEIKDKAEMATTNSNIVPIISDIAIFDFMIFIKNLHSYYYIHLNI